MSRPVEDWELSAYVDGDLPSERMAEIDAEAERSPELWRRLDQILADHRALAGLGAAARDPIGALPPALERQAAVLEDRLSRPRRSGTPGLVVRYWGHAAVLLAGMGFGWAASSAAAPHADALAAFIDEATEIHQVALIAPAFSHMATASAIEGLGTLFGHRIEAPDLASSGFALSGVNVAATDSGPAAVLYYSDPEARRISLVLSLDSPILDALTPNPPGRGDGAPRVTTHDGLAVSFGEGDGIAYALVASMPEPRARALAMHVAATLHR